MNRSLILTLLVLIGLGAAQARAGQLVFVPSRPPDATFDSGIPAVPPLAGTPRPLTFIPAPRSSGRPDCEFRHPPPPFYEPRSFPFNRPFPYFQYRPSLFDRPLGSRAYFDRPPSRDFNAYPIPPHEFGYHRRGHW